MGLALYAAIALVAAIAVAVYYENKKVDQPDNRGGGRN